MRKVGIKGEKERGKEEEVDCQLTMK